MASSANLNSRIIEGLYSEALVLSDDVRSAFVSADAAGTQDISDEARIALSCEALRTTTRMMHALAWLLNHRAFLAGDLSEFQLRRHGKLVEFPEGEARHLALLAPAMRELVKTTERFHARLKRLDISWRERDPATPGAIVGLRERLARQVRG